jgi:hypothetical protein
MNQMVVASVESSKGRLRNTVEEVKGQKPRAKSQNAGPVREF